MALTVATGFVVDDAIVMIENVVRYIEAGRDAAAAAYKGAAQIGFTIVSLTVSLIAVFIPLLFMTGVVGRLFSEFAVTLSVAVMVSAVVSLTLTPMMCGRLLRPARAEKPWLVARLADAGFNRLLAGYTAARCAGRCATSALMLALAAATLAGTILLYVVVPKGFLPLQDTGVIVAVTRGRAEHFDPAHDAPCRRRPPTSCAATRRWRRSPSFVGAGAINATPNTGRLTIALKPRRQRDAGAGVIAARLQRAARRHSRADGVHAAGAGHPDRHPHQPHPVPVHADRHRPGRAGATGRRCCWARCAPLPELRDVATDQQDEGFRHLHPRRPRRRHAARRVDAGGAGHAVRRVRPAAGLAPSSPRPTSTAWCWRPTRPGRPTRFRWPRLRVPGAGGAQVPLAAIATHRAHHRPAGRSPARRSSRR